MPRVKEAHNSTLARGLAIFMSKPRCLRLEIKRDSNLSFLGLYTTYQ